MIQDHDSGLEVVRLLCSSSRTILISFKVHAVPILKVYASIVFCVSKLTTTGDVYGFWHLHEAQLCLIHHDFTPNPQSFCCIHIELLMGRL